MSSETGWLVYIMFAALLGLMWYRVRGSSLQQLIDGQEHEHHHVHRALKNHPLGGAWRDYLAWMDEASESH